MALPNMSNALQKRLIYTLSRQFGNSIVIYKLVSSSYDLVDGGTNITYSLIKVKRAIVMSSKQVRIFAKNFDFGDAFDPKTRFFIIDRRYIKGYSPSLNDYIFHKNKRYKVSEINELENDKIVSIKAEAIEGQLPQELHQAILTNSVNLTDTASS